MMFKKTAVAVIVVAIGWAMWDILDNFDPASLKGKVVLITGASTGIGEQLAYQYAKTGAVLILTARRENVLRKVATSCLDLGSPQVEIIVGDMANASHRQEVEKKTRQLFGRLDYLVLNHMINYPGFWKASETALAELEQMLTVNLFAYIDLASRSLDLLSNCGGSIVVLSSMAGSIALPTMIAYSATKFGLEGFFSGLRKELIYQGRNVTVTICKLGLVNTENTAEYARRLYGIEVEFSGYSMPVNDTAVAILKGASLKRKVMYYPSSSYWMTLGHWLFPEIIDAYLSWGLCGRCSTENPG